MSLWRRVLARLLGMKLEHTDQLGLIPRDILSQCKPGDELMVYSGAIFVRETGTEGWMYKGSSWGAPDSELAAKGSMTQVEIKRYFLMKRFYESVGKI